MKPSLRGTLVVLTVVVAIGVAGLVCWQRQQPRRQAPFEHLSRRLLATHPSWHVYPASGLGLEGGFYLADHVVAAADRERLLRNAAMLSRWQGIVLVTSIKGEAEETEYCRTAADRSLFGDPQMIEQLQGCLERGE